MCYIMTERIAKTAFKLSILGVGLLVGWTVLELSGNILNAVP